MAFVYIFLSLLLNSIIIIKLSPATPMYLSLYLLEITNILIVNILVYTNIFIIKSLKERKMLKDKTDPKEEIPPFYTLLGKKRLYFKSMRTRSIPRSTSVLVQGSLLLFDFT